LCSKVSPHILKYGRVDEATKSLKFPLSRPCDAGEQCFLSYGKHPGSHLITFYGFLPRGDNPYDVIPLGNLLHNYIASLLLIYPANEMLVGLDLLMTNMS
jgi:hypothetical protein